MSQALSELSQQAKELGVSLPGLEEAIQALKSDRTDLFLRDLQVTLSDLEKMKDLARAMQQLQQQAAKLGKDLAEQLEKGQAQAAQSTLQKMIDQLKSGQCSPEQLQKMMEEVSKAIEPGSQYGKVGEHLKNAAQNMQKGQKPNAAQDLAEAAKELDKLMQQMADSQSLRDALDALQRAQACIAMGKNWDELFGTCQACGGRGCGLCRGKKPGWGQGGGLGAGVGTWADEEGGWTYFPDIEGGYDNSGVQRPDFDPRGHSDRPDDLNPNLAPTKVRGQFQPGGSMPSVTLKGVSIKGTSTVQYEEAVTAAQTEAQSALNQDKVPRAYQQAVKDYFDDLKK
jgi:rubrerythrin